jgi:ribosomal protein S12 methylthiotransferase
MAATGMPWIRLLYMHPARLDRQLLQQIAAEDRLLGYLDVPVQHASDRVLEAMNRGVSRQRIELVIAEARELIGSPVLRTTVMVGFPGERRRDFDLLLEFIERTRFDRLGAFAYSKEQGTAAAGRRDSVPAAEKQQRLEQVLEIQREISAELNAARVGTTMPVLIERTVNPDESPGPQYRWAGRSRGHAPEVDGWVYVSGAQDGGPALQPGSIVPVTVTGSGDYDLFASPADG